MFISEIVWRKTQLKVHLSWQAKMTSSPFRCSRVRYSVLLRTFTFIKLIKGPEVYKEVFQQLWKLLSCLDRKKMISVTDFNSKLSNRLRKFSGNCMVFCKLLKDFIFFVNSSFFFNFKLSIIFFFIRFLCNDF